MLRRASPSGFLPNIETSSDRLREFPDTSCSSVADGSRQTGGPFSSSQRCRNTAFCGSFTLLFLSILSLMTVVPKVHHLYLQKQENNLDKQGFIVIIFIKFSRAWAGNADFCSDRAKVTCLLGWGDRSRDFGGYARLVKSRTICPIVEYSAGEDYKPKAGHFSDPTQ